MEIICSVCQDEFAGRVVQSSILPGARFAACDECLKNNAEPRPLVILGYVYGDSTAAGDVVKDRRYCGEEIKAREIMN